MHKITQKERKKTTQQLISCQTWIPERQSSIFPYQSINSPRQAAHNPFGQASSVVNYWPVCYYGGASPLFWGVLARPETATVAWLCSLQPCHYYTTLPSFLVAGKTACSVTLRSVQRDGGWVKGKRRMGGRDSTPTEELFLFSQVEDQKCLVLSLSVHPTIVTPSPCYSL